MSIFLQPPCYGVATLNYPLKGSLFEQSLSVTLECLVLLAMEDLGQDSANMMQRHANME
jgi:hypothetical protein